MLVVQESEENSRKENNLNCLTQKTLNFWLLPNLKLAMKGNIYITDSYNSNGSYSYSIKSILTNRDGRCVLPYEEKPITFITHHTLSLGTSPPFHVYSLH